MIQSIKENPYKSVFAVLIFLSTMIGSVFTVDARYLHAKTAVEMQQRWEIEVSAIQEEVSKQINQLRIRQLEDEIFVLQFKIENGEATALDKALLKRKLEELKSLR